MILFSWLTVNWFALLQTTGIVGGLFFTGWSLHLDAKAHRTDNLLKVTDQHRELWMTLFTKPELARVMQTEIDLSRQPPSNEEIQFVTLLILHLNGSYHAIKAGMLEKPKGLGPDIGNFFNRPIPQLVWGQVKSFYDPDFVAFVDSRKAKSPSCQQGVVKEASETPSRKARPV